MVKRLLRELLSTLYYFAIVSVCFKLWETFGYMRKGGHLLPHTINEVMVYVAAIIVTTLINYYWKNRNG